MKTKEGWVFFAGMFLAFLFALLLLFYGRTEPERALTLLAAFGLHVVGGRVMGIYACLASDFSRWETFLVNFLVELIIVLVCYAVAVWSINGMIQWKPLKIAAKNIAFQAHKREDSVRKYGWIGIFLFVMLPFPMTGPVMGSIIGYFLRMTLRANMTAVFSGTVAALALWTVFFDVLLSSSQNFNITKYVLIGLLILVAAYHSKNIRRFFTEEIPG